MSIVTTNAYVMIREAIINRQQVQCIYQGFRRECCPHVIGFTKGVPRVLVYQFGGGSVTGLPPGGEWRCMDILGMSQVRSLSGTWHTGMRHSRQQTCVKQVELDITMT